MVVKPWEAEKAKKENRAPKRELQKDLSYMGRDNKKNGMWGRVRTYGGMLVENIVQAIARDLMVEGMIRVEAAGYPIVLTVHDEIIAEVKKMFGSLADFCSKMAGPNPKWAEGCPVAVEGWCGPVYKKG
jgi:DNA polymerase